MKCFVVALALLSAAWPVAGQPPTEKPKLKPSLQEQIDSLETKVENLSEWLGLVSAKTQERAVSINCSTGAFSAITPLPTTLTFLVKCDKIEPYLEGYALTIAIANPYSVAFSGLTATLRYGEDWLNSLKNKIPVSTAANLPSGAWTQIRIIINPATAKDVRYTSIDEFQLSLMSPR